MKNNYWPRAIILMDMNAFFASVEQRDHPELRNKPIVITNGAQGSCIITSSYEARAYGIKTGMRLYEAKRLCPKLIQCPSNPKRYVAVSQAIMQELTTITPDIEVFSIDEAFLDVTHCQRLHGLPPKIGLMVKQKIWEVSQLPCSVGVSGDKTTAKYAANCYKPDGFMVIPPWEARKQLANVPVTELCGISHGIAGFLAQYGAHTCGDVTRLPISILAKRFGNFGRRIWTMCHGADLEPLQIEVKAPKSMGHGKILPPNTVDVELIEFYLLYMSEKLAERLRRHEMRAQYFFIGLRCQHNWLGGQYLLSEMTHDVKLIYELAIQVMKKNWFGQPVSQVQITALNPQHGEQQLTFWDTSEQEHRDKLNHAKDVVNQRFGEHTLVQAKILAAKKLTNVIAPAWKPKGHRQTI